MKNPVKDFPEKYKIANFNEYVQKANTSYENGDWIEAFVILYSILELELMAAWGCYVLNVTGKDKFKPLKYAWEYSNLVELLFEFRLISEIEKSIFLDFKKGRNDAVHNLLPPFRKQISRKNFELRFKKGLKAFKIINQVLRKVNFPLSKI